MKKILSIVMTFLIIFSTISAFTPQIRADSEPSIFQDDFEAYSVESFPSAGGWELVWNGKGTQYQIVTDTVSHSPTKSLQLWGQSGWSANVQREFTSNSETLGYEAYVRADSNVGTGHNIASICFWDREGLAWGKRFVDTWFGQDGEIYTRAVSESPFIPLGLTYEADRWYKVRVVIDRTVETYDVWIDDALAAQDVVIWDTDEIDALMLQSGHAGIKAYFDDVEVFEGATTAGNLRVNVFDESGFPPSSTSGTRSLPDIPVEIYTLGDSLVATGVTDSTGTISFNLPEDSYKIVYGGKVTGATGGGGYGVASQIVDVSGTFTEVDLYCFQVTYHSYEAGGPYELNYIDLDTGSTGYQDVITVRPGESVNAEFSWWELETRNVPVWYVSAFGEWDPTTALGNLGSGCASPSSHNLYTVPLTFTAPTTPGTYKIRMVGVLDYRWPNSYYTGNHYQPSLGRDTCMAVISKGIHEPYAIGTITVSSEAEPDFEISVSPTSQSVLREESAEYEITITSLNGFNNEVTLSASIQPGSFLTCNISPEKVTPPPDGTAQSILTVRATEFGSVGTKVVHIAGISGGKERGATITVLVDMVDGIETVVSFDSYTTAFSFSFSIQQNFWVKGGFQRYWAQNIIWVWPLTNRMAGIFEIYNYTYPDLGVRIIAWWMYYRSGPARDTVTMCSTLEGNTLRMTNDYSALTWNLPGSINDDWFIQTVKRSSSEDYRPELVLVGPMKFLIIGGHVDFLYPTSGDVDTYVRTSVSTEWSRGENQVIESPEGSSTAETSSGLDWTSMGDFEYALGSGEQGLKFTYDYDGSIVIPPTVTAETGTSATMTVIDAHCPINLSLYDASGNHVGYDTLNGQIDFEIPETFYHFSEEMERIVIINPSGEYQLSVIGTGDDIFTLRILQQNETGAISTLWNSTGTISKDATLGYRISIFPPQHFVTMFVHDIDVDSDTLNLKSNGEWVTAYIELPAGYNLSDICISTVQINNTISVDSSAPTQIGDYDLDGVPDLMVKFDRASIIEWLGAIDYSEETGKSCLVTVSITGNVLDVLFEGLDTIKMLRK